MICYRCKNNIPNDAVKCPVCGVKTMPFVGAKACPRCGTVNPVSARFCISDGYSFVEEEGQTVHDEDDRDEGYDEENEEETATAASKKHGILRLFMWLLIAIVCLIGSAVAGYHIFKPKTYQIETQAMDALAGAGLKNISVKVDLSKTAKLAGTAKNADEKAFAEVIVQKIPKVARVENNIIVMQVVPKPEELEKAINKSLNSQGFPGIVVSVNTALAASVIGTVPSEYDRNKVLSIVKTNKDVKDIKDNLNVDATLAQPAATVQPLSPPTSPPSRPVPPTPQPAEPNEQTDAPAPVQSVSTPKPAPEPARQPQPTAVIAPQPAPGTLESSINSALKNAGLTKVTAEVNENLDVTLKGTVSSTRDKNKAFDTTKQVKGTKKIKDKVFVVEQ
ncbi:BON domain-containing protein [Candidatus Magnetominusculus xianensis]|uniref:Periplasmic or secreted lipoprotein n=1 Tax=Candidatus Magnetominusculus xianensis TaxID=1748249 RepID=A0ABR5SD24_9BACT|nr:BON domain-containing protein [Candidatus Magnetominusculus xianensis]KWT82644.1 putative periplasmic or secreted lipoprotein [Candidatus Magnetominusculus xianensis]MBF0405293.1 BON domain-containing protein [Nitrospirota bacterium]